MDQILFIQNAICLSYLRQSVLVEFFKNNVYDSIPENIDEILVEKNLLSKDQVKIIKEKMGSKIQVSGDFFSIDLAGGKTIEVAQPKVDETKDLSGIENKATQAIELPPGEILLDKYRVVRKLGGGGMGTVYKIEHLLLQNKFFALKLMHPTMLGKEQNHKRFMREIEMAMSVSHKHIASIREFGILKDRGPFLTMDFSEGKTLQEIIKQDWSCDVNKSLEIICQILDALKEAHRLKIIHRDLKPANILVEKDDDYIVKIVDFGLARLIEPNENITQGIIGTPMYMSPEQIAEGKIDQRSDLYAVGLILYELLTKQLPFKSETLAGFLQQQLLGQPKSPLEFRPDLPKKLVDIIFKVLEKDASYRYQDADAFIKAIEKFQNASKPQQVKQSQSIDDVIGEIEIFQDSHKQRFEDVEEKVEEKAEEKVEEKVEENISAENKNLNDVLGDMEFFQNAQKQRIEEQEAQKKLSENQNEEENAQDSENQKRKQFQRKRAVDLFQGSESFEKKPPPQLPKVKKQKLAETGVLYKKNTNVDTKKMVSPKAKRKNIIRYLTLSIIAVVVGLSFVEDPKKLLNFINQGEESQKIALQTDPWISCWNGQVLDFTDPAWQKFSHQEQVKYAKMYQRWFAKENNLKTKKKIYVKKVPFTMVLIPPGRFWMGAKAKELGSLADEKPRYKTTIEHSFWISETEITQGQWYQITKKKPWKKELYAKESANNAVNYVSWNEINQKFLPALGDNFFLPTEIQWEHAARAGTHTRFYWGEDTTYKKINRYAWYHENTEMISEQYPHAVAKKQPNPWGLYDMSGNVWEWCLNRKQEYPLTDENMIFEKGKKQSYRGGGWLFYNKFCRSAARGGSHPRSRFSYVGFRIVLIEE